MTRRLAKKMWKKSNTTIKIDLGMGSVLLFALAYFLYTTYHGTGHPSNISMVQEYTGHSLVRMPALGWFGGVLAGFAYHFSIPLWLLRLGFVFAVLVLDDIGDLLIVAYILLWIFMPAITFVPMDFIARAG